MKTRTLDAIIDTMTTASLILHLVSAALPEDDLNKAIKSTILEQLRKDPDQPTLEPVLGKIKTLEAGGQSGMARTGITNKNRKVTPGDDQPKQWKCKCCGGPHSRTSKKREVEKKSPHHIKKAYKRKPQRAAESESGNSETDR